MITSAMVVVLSSVGTLGVDNNQRNLGHRAIVFIICVFGAFVYWSYCAVLVSYLTVIDNELPINTLEDILRNKGYSMILRKRTTIADYFSEADLETNPVAYNILQEGLRNNCYSLKYCILITSFARLNYNDFLQWVKVKILM